MKFPDFYGYVLSPIPYSLLPKLAILGENETYSRNHVFIIY